MPETISTDIDTEKPRAKVRFAKTTKVNLTRTLPRLIEKNGTCNIESRTIRGKNIRFMSDIFTTLLETQWRLFLSLFALSVVFSWVLFATVYFLIAYSNGDFEEKSYEEDRLFCVENTPDFISMILFSMETQTTIGYGSRYVTDHCPAAVFMVTVQSILGALLQALLTGIVIAKVQKPKKRGNTILFSKSVCICQDGEDKYMYIRVGDLQKSDMIDMHARAVCVKDKITSDGEYISHFRHDLDLCNELNSSRISLRWPVVLQHKITPASPFWALDEGEIKSADFELLVFLQGVIESTGMSFQARTSYLSHEILWQHKFKPMSTVCTTSGVFQFDYKQFNETINFPSTTPSPGKKFFRAKYVRSSSPGDHSLGGESGIADMDDALSTNSDSSTDISNDSTKYGKVSLNMYD
ncbi:ATP-sensitive inward rectifier potassium channel 12-like [Saccostrea echinata]|uniref:ATP-sensitive inward rectifier potassium channel 12-like n=1 Tax=Saccostrea echinata TaxID=191078 RepID=UPI002A7FEB40|nr:ATP-sensitive inward rectifier potassium channel 12-like [Saccostrea echinata]